MILPSQFQIPLARPSISPPLPALTDHVTKEKPVSRVGKKASEMLLSQLDEVSPRGTITVKTEGYFHKQNIEWKSSMAYYKTVFCFCFLIFAWINLKYNV